MHPIGVHRVQFDEQGLQVDPLRKYPPEQTVQTEEDKGQDIQFRFEHVVKLQIPFTNK